MSPETPEGLGHATGSGTLLQNSRSQGLQFVCIQLEAGLIFIEDSVGQGLALLAASVVGASQRARVTPAMKMCD